MKATPPTDQRSEHELYLLLTDLFYLLDDTDRQFFGEYGLSTRQFWALHHLSETHDLSMIDLSRLLFTDKSNITAIADRLEGARLIKRSPAPQDRRMTLLTLTPQGRALHDEVYAAHQERIRSIIGGADVALRQVIEQLERIRSQFERHLRPDTLRDSSSQAHPSPALHPSTTSAAASHANGKRDTRQD